MTDLTKIEQLATELMYEALGDKSWTDQVAVGDALRGALQGVIDVVVVKLGGQREWTEAHGFVGFPYVMQAINAVAGVTGGNVVEPEPTLDINMSNWLADAFKYYLADPNQDYLKAPLANARAEQEANPGSTEYGPAFLQLRREATDYIREGWLDDGMLEDAVGDALAPYVYGELKDQEDDTSACEVNADYENPAGY